MDIITVPEATYGQQRIAASQISFVDHRDQGGPFRNRVLFNRYAFSFVQEGEKRIYRVDEQMRPTATLLPCMH